MSTLTLILSRHRLGVKAGGNVLHQLGHERVIACDLFMVYKGTVA